MPRHSKDGICFKDRQSRYRARQVFMHCCLAVRAAAKVREARSASSALSFPVLDDRSAAKSTETTANDRLLQFMAEPLEVEKHDRIVRSVVSHFREANGRSEMAARSVVYRC